MKMIYWLIKTLNKLRKTDELVGKSLVFSTLRYLPFPIHQDLFMANILARKGAKVYVILDNGLYLHWDTYQFKSNNQYLNPFHKRFKELSYLKTYLHTKILLFIYKHSNISIVDTKSIVDMNKLDEINLSEADKSNLISSVRRYFGCGYYDESNTSHYEYYLKTEINCKISKSIGKYIIDVIKPNKFITTDGIYSLWGPIYCEVKNAGIPSYIYGYHTYTDDEALFSNTLAQTLSKDETWIVFNEKTDNLTPEQNQKVVNYFETRIQHKTKDTTIYYGGISTFKEINIEKENDDIMNIGVFPNIIWDGDVVQRDKYFNGVLDWILKTIKIAETSKHNFIIRFHPAESTLFKDSNKLKDILLGIYPNLTSLKNLTLIDSDVKIDTYKFIENNIDLGIVYDGILTMELTYMKIPVVTPSISRFSAGNFVINPSSEYDYINYLNDKGLINHFYSDIEKIDLEFKKYAYWYLFEAGYFMSIYDKTIFGKIVYSKNTLEYIATDRFRRFENKLAEYL